MFVSPVTALTKETAGSPTVARWLTVTAWSTGKEKPVRFPIAPKIAASQKEGSVAIMKRKDACATLAGKVGYIIFC